MPPGHELPADLESRVIEILEGEPTAVDRALEALCAAHPAHAAAVAKLVAAARLASRQDRTSLAAAFAGLAAAMPLRIGPYRLLERLASGGMGIVYLAEQTEPVRRKVALKVLTAGVADPEFRARFLAERQALAMLDHPHIAKVYDAGCADDGTPFLALEYVASRLTITEYCNQQRLPVRDRLRLFLRICDAVQHAHSRGILHRDLKPGNVLVDHSGRDAAPKVIDFGIAKTLAGPLTDSPFTTRAGVVLGTSVYMSPEQARGSLDIDTRTDVYSLGALAYELLVGEYPGEEHDLGGLFQRDLAQFLAHVTTVPPTAPGERARALGDGTARRCQLTAAKLARLLRGDLDAIVLRALAKNREQRYASAADLARDVERFLAGQPIEARGLGVVYRLRKFVARHAVGAAGGALVLAAGTFGVVNVLAANDELGRVNHSLAERNRELEQERAATTAALAQARASEQRAHELQQEADRERRAAEAARGEAEAASAAAQQSQREATESLQRVRSQVAVADEVRQTLADLLADASRPDPAVTVVAFLDRVRTLLDSKLPLWSPEVEAGLRKSVGWLLWGLGNDAQARRQFEILVERPAASSEERLERAAALHALGDAVLDVGTLGKRKVAIARLREALAILQAEQRGERDPRLLRVQGDLAFLLMQTGDAADDAEGQRLIADSLCKALGFTNQITGMLGILDAVQRLNREVKTKGFAAGAHVIDEFLAPILAESLLRQRLCDILVAAATYPQLRSHRELVLRCALRYGERFNGRGHRHSSNARLQLAGAIADRASASREAASREEFFRLVAEQAAIDQAFGRVPALARMANTFAEAVATAMGDDGKPEFARLADLFAAEFGPDNLVVTALRARGGP